MKSHLNLDHLVDRTVTNRWWDPQLVREKLQEQISEYESIKLTLEIGDEPMRRVCEVLTSYWFVTLESCDGHWIELPRIYFSCEDQQQLRYLAYMLIFRKSSKHFKRWAKIWSWNPFVVPESPLTYELVPMNYENNINPSTDYGKLKEDLDIIWIELIEWMENGHLEEE